MYKRTVAIGILSLSLPLMAWAESKAERAAPRARPPVPAASAPAPVDPAHAARAKAENRARMEHMRARGPAMSACQKQAADKGLNGPDRKLFVGKCMSGAA